MSFAALRNPLRRSAVQASRSFRKPVQVRFNSTAPPAPKSNSGLYAGLAAALAVGGGIYFYTQGSDAANTAGTVAKSGAQSVKSYVGFVPTKQDYQKVYDKIASILDAEGYDDGSYGPVLVRLAWHASGTYDKDTKTGGSNYATMRFAPESLHGANNGLNVARNILEPIKQEFPWISYGDLWTLAGVAAVQEMGGPKIPWRPGRIDGFEKDVTPDGRLPDAKLAQDHLRQIFYRMGFNDQEIVALTGCHALGRCHTDRSGFDGPWTFSPTSFTNAYFQLLLDEKWVEKKWTGPKQFVDKKTGSLMMLPADMALIQDKKFKEWVQKYAKDEALFFKDFSNVYARLLELGVPNSQWVTSDPWIMGEEEK